MSETTPKLPQDASNGDIVCDRYGNIWEFDGTQNTWVFKGGIGEAPPVSEQEDGFVTPDIHDQLEYLSQLKDLGISFDILKVEPAIDGYWYKLISTNKTIRFEPESENKVRIEIDKGRLTRTLSMLKCPGKQGPPGDQGLSGKDGTPASPEIQYIPVTGGTDGLALFIDATIETELDTDVSVRLFRDGSAAPALDYRISLETGALSFTAIDADLDGNIDTTKTILEVLQNPTDGTSQVVGSIYLTDTTWDSLGDWAYRAGQVGKTGERGDDGLPTLEIVPTEFQDPILRSKKAIVSLRQDDARGDIYFLRAELFEKNCVQYLSIQRVCEIFQVAANEAECFIGVKRTLDECKDTDKYCLDLICPDKPSLTFPEWTPTDVCWSQRHFNISTFDWAKITNVGEDVVPWPEANQRDDRNPAYPWNIVTPGAPGERCCQEDFFYCPNVNEAECPITEVNPIARPLSISSCCICDCPIALEIQNGLDFKIIKVKDGDVSGGDEDDPLVAGGRQNTAVCTVDGSFHTYRQRMELWSTDLSLFTRGIVKISVEFNDICDEARSIAGGGDVPNFGIPCPPVVSVGSCDLQFAGLGEVFGGGQNGSKPVELTSDDQVAGAVTDTDPTEIEFDGQSGYVDVTVTANSTRADCCLGYKITVAIEAEQYSASPSISLSPSYYPPPYPAVGCNDLCWYELFECRVIFNPIDSRVPEPGEQVIQGQTIGRPYIDARIDNILLENPPPPPPAAEFHFMIAVSDEGDGILIPFGGDPHVSQADLYAINVYPAVDVNPKIGARAGCLSVPPIPDYITNTDYNFILENLRPPVDLEERAEDPDLCTIYEILGSITHCNNLFWSQDWGCLKAVNPGNYKAPYAINVMGGGENIQSTVWQIKEGNPIVETVPDFNHDDYDPDKDDHDPSQPTTTATFGRGPDVLIIKHCVSCSSPSISISLSPSLSFSPSMSFSNSTSISFSNSASLSFSSSVSLSPSLSGISPSLSALSPSLSAASPSFSNSLEISPSLSAASPSVSLSAASPSISLSAASPSFSNSLEFSASISAASPSISLSAASPSISLSAASPSISLSIGEPSLSAASISVSPSTSMSLITAFGPVAPGNASDTAGGFFNWTSELDVLVEDGFESFAENLSGSRNDSNILTVEFNSIDFFAIPGTATIVGMQIRIKRRCDVASDANDIKVLPTGTPSGTPDDKADLVTKWPTVLGFATYGGPADDWGAGYTAASLASDGVTLDIQVECDNASTAFIDFVECTIYYTDP
jgi:hypothetical protein